MLNIKYSYDDGITYMYVCLNFEMRVWMDERVNVNVYLFLVIILK